MSACGPVELRRVQPMQAGEYSVRRGGHVAIACPSCGTVSKLDWPYRVSQLGAVAPAWQCIYCSWSGELKLVDYAEAVLT